LKKEIEKISKSNSISKEEGVRLALGTTAFLSAVMIDIMDQRNWVRYRKEHFYQDVSNILNKVLRQKEWHAKEKQGY
jgi:hypothetical protein